jgi:hypothetical protein
MRERLIITKGCTPAGIVRNDDAASAMAARAMAGPRDGGEFQIPESKFQKTDAKQIPRPDSNPKTAIELRGTGETPASV